MKKRVIGIVLVVVVVIFILGLSYIKITGNSFLDDFFAAGASEFGVFGGTAVNDLGEVYQCGTINESGSYALNQSINASSTPGVCLDITAADVILDGAGFDLFGNDTADTYGVSVENHMNIIIKDFNNITDFTYGVYFVGTNESLIENLTVNSNNKGVYIKTDDYNNLSGITASNNQYGILLGDLTLNLGVNYTRVTDINSYGNSYGVYMGYGYHNVLYNITAVENSNSGVQIYIGSHNNLSLINASYNQYGIEFDCAETSNLIDSVTNYNSVNGIVFGGAGSYNDCDLLGYSGYNFTNIVSNGNLYGIYASEMNTSNFTNIVVSNNSDYGVYFYNFNESTIKDGNFSGNVNNDSIFEDAVNNIFVNVTYNQTNSYIYETSSFYRQWWLDATSNVADTTITVTGDNYSETGTSPARFELTEYYFNGTDSNYYSNYVVSASKSGYTASAAQTVNMSENQAVSFTMTAVPAADSPAGGGGGGGGGATSTGFWTNTYLVNDTQINNGHSGQIGAKERFKINIKSEIHYVGVINLTINRAIINLSSVSIQDVFSIGQERRWDADGNGLNDILIRLENITGGKAVVFVQALEEVVDGDANVSLDSNNTGSGDDSGGSASANSVYWIYALLIVIVLVGVGLGAYFFIKKNSKSKKEINKKEIKVVKKEEQKKDFSKGGEEKKASKFSIWISGLRKRYKAYRLKSEKQRLVRLEEARKSKEEREKQKKLEQEKRLKEEKERLKKIEQEKKIAQEKKLREESERKQKAEREEKERQKRRELEIKAKDEKEKKLRDEKERQRKAEEEIKRKKEVEQKAKKSPLMSEIIQTIEKSEKAIEKKDIVKAKDLYESAAERYNSTSEEDREVKERLLKVYKKLGF